MNYLIYYSVSICEEVGLDKEEEDDNQWRGFHKNKTKKKCYLKYTLELIMLWVSMDSTPSTPLLITQYILIFFWIPVKNTNITLYMCIIRASSNVVRACLLHWKRTANIFTFAWKSLQKWYGARDGGSVVTLCHATRIPYELLRERNMLCFHFLLYSVAVYACSCIFVGIYTRIYKSCGSGFCLHHIILDFQCKTSATSCETLW